MGLMMNVPTKDYIVETIKEEILSGQISRGQNWHRKHLQSGLVYRGCQSGKHCRI